jgi:hypothetical protein
MKPTIKDPKLIEIVSRFEQAVYTLRRLPSAKARGFFSTWPPIVRTAEEIMLGEPDKYRMGPPTSEAITRMDETIQWIFLLDSEDERRLVWLRAAKVPWRPICQQLGFCRTTGHTMWKAALEKIATRLKNKRNGGRNVP